jgi:hypothetical protein
MILPGPIAVFPKLHIQQSMQLILDASMLSHTLSKPFQAVE